MKLPESPTTAQSLPDTIPPDQIIANALEKLYLSDALAWNTVKPVSAKLGTGWKTQDWMI